MLVRRRSRDAQDAARQDRSDRRADGRQRRRMTFSCAPVKHIQFALYLYGFESGKANLSPMRQLPLRHRGTRACALRQHSPPELLMYRRAGCPWCAAWDREIGPVYPKTEIGRRLPVRFVDLDKPCGPANL